MSGGSEEPESPHDKKCPNCGLYYVSRGPSFTLHTASCDGGDSSSSETASETVSEQSEAEQSEAGSNPAMSGPSAETGTQQPQTESSGTELPCGCETVDLSTADPPVIIECETCGREYPYE